MLLKQLPRYQLESDSGQFLFLMMIGNFLFETIFTTTARMCAVGQISYSKRAFSFSKTKTSRLHEICKIFLSPAPKVFSFMKGSWSSKGGSRTSNNGTWTYCPVVKLNKICPSLDYLQDLFQVFQSVYDSPL